MKGPSSMQNIGKEYTDMGETNIQNLAYEVGLLPETSTCSAGDPEFAIRLLQV